MITFEEYSLLESFIGSENFQILLEKNLGSKINNDIKFGIVMATHDMNAGAANKSRAKHMTTPGVLTDALNSVKAQKYKNWKIYITADKYEGDEGEIKKVMEDVILKIKYNIKTDLHQEKEIIKSGQQSKSDLQQAVVHSMTL